MIRVGLTGGYATGKSFVASAFEELGCHLIYADRLGHEVLLPGGKAYAPAIALFGAEILDDNGLINRKRLGSIVFDNPDLLRQLNKIVHPAVFELEELMLKRYASEDPRGIAMIEAAILIETGRYRVFDRMILTDCSEELQLERGIQRDGVTREQALARIRRQLPAEKKREYADFVVNTDGAKEDTIRQALKIFRQLDELAHSPHKTEVIVL